MTKATCSVCGAAFEYEYVKGSTSVTCPHCAQTTPIKAPGRTMAKWALVLGILSLVLCGIGPILFGPFALIFGIIAYSSGRQGKALAAIILAIISFILLPIVGLGAAIMLPALARAREAARTVSCANNLKQLYIGMQDYSDGSPGQTFPPLSSEYGNLMMDEDSVYPDYITSLTLFSCPSHRDATEIPSANDDAYIYLGYVIRDAEDVQIFVEGYEEHFPEGEGRWNDMRGGAGNKKLFRLRQGIARNLVTDVFNPVASSQLLSSIPLIIERPGSHIRGQANVLFMDGHVELMAYPSRFPMVPEVIEPLLALANQD